MSAVWNEKGSILPVTLIQAGPCQVTQIKTIEKDGYSAVQVGFDAIKKPNKPLKGHLKDLPSFRYLREITISKEEVSSFKRGDVLDIKQFATGDKTMVSGISKGQGFQGVVKRHGFAGSPKTHGHKDQLRMPGSIGVGGIQHVRKGMRMAGRMGDERVTIRNLKVVKIEPEKNLIYVKGAVPGGRGALLMISA